MYSQLKVEQRLALAEKEFGVRPEYHSIADVEEFEAHLRRRGMYSYDETGTPSGVHSLTQFEHDWMQNEQTLVLCNPPEAPIWMGDLSFKSLGEIKIGDEIMGWCSMPNRKGRARENWTKARVLAVNRRVAPLVRVTLASGKTIRCTPDHLWSSGCMGRANTPWIKARVGWYLRRAVDVYPNEPSDIRKAGWIAGLYDGEGSGVTISQDLGHNPAVYSAIVHCLRDLGFEVGVQANGRTLSINGGISERSRFVAQCRPVRAGSMEKYIFKSLHTDRDLIVAVEPDGEGEVVSMTTTSGNYVAWGYCSKNCDASYFLTRYSFLKNQDGIVQRFQFRVPQRIYFDIVCDLEARDASIEILALKARQLGISIFTELLIGHRSIFTYGTNSVIGSADQTKTSEMSRMLLMCYDMLPVWLRPQHTSRVESDRGKMLFGTLASGVSFQHGAQKFGIATGSTPQLYHLSEVALYGDAAVKLIDEGLWKAVHASTSVLGVLESTGRGDKGWWADTWRFSKDNWPRCRMYPMFLPWFCGVDIYPTPTDMRTRPIPTDWRPSREAREMRAKAELYVASTPLLLKHLLAEQARRGTATPDGRWHLPVEQQWYWEWNYKEAKAKGTDSSFLQEMAGNDEEALQRSTESVFGHETMATIESARASDFLRYTLSGQSIEDAHEIGPEYYDYDQTRIPVRYASRKGAGEVYRWELIPLKYVPMSGKEPSDAEGVLLVFHPPAPGIDYSIGVDTSEGKGEDSTVISVWTYGRKGQPDVQCAEFASAFVNHVEAFSFILCIAAYYSQFMAAGKEAGVCKWKEPYVSIEQVAAVGDTAQGQMALMGYSNFHRMPRYDSSPRRIAKQKRGPTAKLGWYTFGYTRPILTGNFVHSAQNGWAEINSPWLIEEMKHFEVHHTASGKEKMEHEEGEHDDRIFSAAMAIFCPHDRDVLAERSKKRSIESVSLPPIDLGPYRGGVVSAAEIDQRVNPVVTLNDIVYSDAGLTRFDYGR